MTSPDDPKRDGPRPSEKLIASDPWLKDFAWNIDRRAAIAQSWLETLERQEGGIENFAKGYEYFGFQVDEHTNEIVYREWAPNVISAHLCGDFNGWNRTSHPMHRSNNFGVWEIRLPPLSGNRPAISHNSKVKIVMETPSHEFIERLPAWIRRVVQEPEASPVYEAVFWNPPEKYKFKNPRPVTDLTKGGAKIYEAHIGISTPEPRIGTYNEFKDSVLPHISELGYNSIQLMAIMEHAYYGSFGYQVTSFFAVSSRFGTPEELMALIDAAHGMGITVLLDVVHSHASKNVLDGLNMFDGTDYQYFHAGPKGNHNLWDSRLFDYGKHEVLRFLLSNLRFYLDVYKFDGFRFDGVTSMLYTHHGTGTGFSGSYGEYFGDHVDTSAMNYLILANSLIHKLDSKYLTIAEDVSGMPGLCFPVSDGGLGFNYRLGMAIPDMWIKMLKEQRDEDWDMGHIAYILSNRRYKELTIAYPESHDQALVGDKTLAFWLMDKLMYTHMSKLSEHLPEVSRGIALHKMIRLVTHALGGEGYLNFEGNEFGHPEWLDFPREGNNESYHYARRQFNLLQDDLLLYQYLNEFDKALQHTESRFHWLISPPGYVSRQHNGDKILAFDRGGLVFLFNFHPTQSYTDYKIGVPISGKYTIVLNTDSTKFYGFGLVNENTEFFTASGEWDCRPHSIQVYVPCRTALVFAPNIE